MIKKYFLQTFTILIAVIFGFRLIELQLVNSEYKSLSENNAVLERSIFPDRGFIFDRNNKILVANQPSYDLIIIPENTSNFDSNELSQLLGISIEELNLNINKAINYSSKIPSVISSEISKFIAYCT